MDGSILIKGTRDGLTITLGEGDLDRLYDELSSHLSMQGAFFRGGMVALELGDRALSVESITRFQGLLKQHSMTLRSVASIDEHSVNAAKELGLRVTGAERQSDPGAEAMVTPEPEQAPAPAPALVQAEGQAEALARAGARGLVMRRRLRAGQTVRHSGSVVVIGDVNAGAEISAGGDIVVWGRLRGTVHAGCLGNTSAVVCALELGPLQLRIGDMITRPDEGGTTRGEGYPEVAYIKDGSIIVERWSGIRWRE